MYGLIINYVILWWKKLLDSAIFFRELTKEEIEDKDKEWEPEIAVEMKWTGLKKDG